MKKTGGFLWCLVGAFHSDGLSGDELTMGLGEQSAEFSKAYSGHQCWNGQSVPSTLFIYFHMCKNNREINLLTSKPWQDHSGSVPWCNFVPSY